MFAGNCGAVIAGAPLAWVVTQASWRAVFVGLALVSIGLAAATWRFVRDRPEELGFAAVHAATRRRRSASTGPRALRQVLANPRDLAGVLRQRRHRRQLPRLRRAVGGAVPAGGPRACRAALAAQHASVLLLGVAVGALVVGVVSDRLGSRRGVMRAYALLYALSWLPWLPHVAWPLPATLAWFLLMGLLIPGFTLSWTIAKEVNRPEHSGIATAVVNVGIFLGTGILQPLVGFALDRGRAAGDAAAWERGIPILAGAAALGALCTLLVRESKPGDH